MSTNSRHTPTGTDTVAFKEPVEIHFDGSHCDGRHASAIGFTLTDATDTTLAETNQEISYTTSVQTELTALHKALTHALSIGVRDITIHTDCHPVLELLRDDAHTNKDQLRALVEDTKELLDEFNTTTLTKIARTDNTTSDSLARSALDAASD